MAIRIVRDGAAMPVPEDAYRCPNCGHIAEDFKIQEKVMTYYEKMQSGVLRPVMLPTFECERCCCIWQYDKDGPPTPKPCPKCGSASVEEVEAEPAQRATSFRDGVPPKYAIQCKDCGFRGPSAFAGPDFVNGWNELQRDESTDGRVL